MTRLLEVISLGGARLEATAVARATGALDRAGQRMRLGADLTVVALVGATGSGKSSLFNALAGMDIADVGARRPTTSQPTACVWGGRDAGALLDWLDVDSRHRTVRESVLDADRQAPLHGLVLLDLPDHDSAFVGHRLEVDRLVELVDLLIWVVDPQKYADEALHSGYLKPLHDRADVMLVVLNQVDKLGPDETRTCLADLQRLLDADGLAGVAVLPVSARRGDGVEALRGAIAQTVQARATAVARTAADLDAAANQLLACCGVTEPDPQRLPGASELVTAMSEAAGVPVVLQALASDYRRRAAARLTWPYLRWWQRLRPDPLRKLGLSDDGAELRDASQATVPSFTPSQQARVDLAVRALAEATAAELPRLWADAVRGSVSQMRRETGLDAAGDAGLPVAGTLPEAIDAAVASVELPAGEPRWWAVLDVVQVVVALATMVGLVWLAGIGVLDWGGDSPVTSPFVGVFPLPTLLFFGGLLVGGILVGAAFVASSRAAVRMGERLADQLYDAVAEVAWTRVLTPVSSILADHRSVRQALQEFS